MNLDEAFPSKYLRASDLGTTEPVVTIDRIAGETIGDDTKLVAYFKGKERGLVLNKTNANSIADILNTRETDEWVGGRIKLFVAKVEYQGKRVPAVRIDAPPRNGAPAAAKPAPPPVEAPDDDDIPF